MSDFVRNKIEEGRKLAEAGFQPSPDDYRNILDRVSAEKDRQITAECDEFMALVDKWRHEQ